MATETTEDTTDEAHDALQTIYLSLFGREASPEERAFFGDYVDLTDPKAVQALARTLIASEDFQESFAAESPENFVRSVVFNLFDRNAEADEIDRWTKRLETDTFNRDDLPSAILDGASEADTEAYEAKLYIANFVTDQADEEGYVPEGLTTAELRSNDELYADLNRLDDERDTLSLEKVGESLGDRPLYAATVGTGKTNIMFVTQQHGDEPIGTEAAMHLLDFLSGDSEQAEAIREEVTVTVMPRINPDGFDRWERQVGGEQGLIDPRLNDEELDLNRTYDPDDPVSRRDAPESIAVQKVVKDVDPDLLFDYHGQGNYRGEDGTLDTMSLLWPTNDDVERSVTNASKQAAAAIADTLEDGGYGNLSLYPGAENPAIGRNGFAIEGTPTVLVEQRYSQEMGELAKGLDLDYSALRGALAVEGFTSMEGILEAAADGSLKGLEADAADAIPDRADGIEYAELYTDDDYTPTADPLVS